jgi:hypothetical protein
MIVLEINSFDGRGEVTQRGVNGAWMGCEERVKREKIRDIAFNCPRRRINTGNRR